MVDPRVVLIVLAIAGAVYGVQWLGHEVKVGAREVGCGVARLVGYRCAPRPPDQPPVFDPGSVEVEVS